jgi:ABC-type glycerol-3-phosphate transport system substrate-binding protein
MNRQSFDYMQSFRSHLMDYLRESLKDGNYLVHTEGDFIFHVFNKDYENHANDWFRVRMVPTPPLYYGFTMTVWGKPPASIDPSEVYEVSKTKYCTGLEGVKETKEVLRLARTYFLESA